MNTPDVMQVEVPMLETEGATGLLPATALSLVADNPCLRLIEQRGTATVLHIQTARGRGTASLGNISDLTDDEAADLIRETISSCPFAAPAEEGRGR